MVTIKPHSTAVATPIRGGAGRRSAAPTTELFRDVLDDGRELIRLEVALATDELRQELASAKRAAMAFGIAALVAVLALSMLLVALALAISIGPIPALVIGILLLAIAVVAGVMAYGYLPKHPLEESRDRVQKDVRMLRERIA